MHGLITHELAGAHRAFRLTLPGYFEIERRAAGGLGGLLDRLRGAEFTIADIALGLAVTLVGGGQRPEHAAAFVTGMKLRDLQLAALIVGAALTVSILAPDGEEVEDTEGNDSDERPTLGQCYKNAYAIGLKPREVDQLTPWEFSQCVDGWNLAHGAEPEVKAPKPEELDDLIAQYGG